MFRHVCRSTVSKRILWCRTLSTPASREVTDPIRTGIQNLLMEHQQHASNTSPSPSSRIADLKQSLATFESRLKEAESCVDDYRECTSEEEMDNAEKAIDQAVGCLVEVLEDMKVSEEKVDTDDFVRRIKQLRADLEEAPSPSDMDGKHC